MDYCVRAGVKSIICFGMGLTLRDGNREYFYAALDRLFPSKNGEPSMKQRYIRTFGNSYVVSSPYEKELMAYLSELCTANGIMLGVENVFNWMRDFPKADPLQPELF